MKKRATTGKLIMTLAMACSLSAAPIASQAFAEDVPLDPAVQEAAGDTAEPVDSDESATGDEPAEVVEDVAAQEEAAPADEQPDPEADQPQAEEEPAAFAGAESGDVVEPAAEPLSDVVTAAPRAFSPEETLDVVYAAQDVVSVGEVQQLAFILSNKSADIQAAALELFGSYGDVWVEAANCVGNGVLFDVSADALGAGEVSLGSLELRFSDGSTQTVDFSLGQQYYSFQIEEPAGSQVSMTAYTLTPEGDYVEAASVEDALAAVDDGTLAAAAEGIDPDGETATLAGATGIIIGLDPGHDNYVGGAEGYGVYEEEANLAIALACRDELETYEGVTVVMTRDSMACPAPGESEGTCLRTRAKIAADAGCVVLVSFHLDSAETDSAHGVSVWYPNQSVDPNIGDAGHELADEIQSQLVALGLRDNGTRESPNYSDESDLDYYAMMRYPKQYGMAGIIIEHCFVSSSIDNRYVSNPDALRKLGIADATGIASYFGLQKAGLDGATVAKCGGTMSVTDVDSETRMMTIKGGRVWCSNGIDQVLAKIEIGGTVYSYNLVQQADGSWTTTAELPAGIVCAQATIWGAVIDDDGNTILFDKREWVLGRFNDLAWNGWYLDYVDTAANLGIMTGLRDDDGVRRAFAPESNVTRAQVATILYRIVHPSSTATTVPSDYGTDGVFGDVASGLYYTAAVRWAYEAGIVTGDLAADGTPLNTFRPDDFVTREELATMLYRASKLFGLGGTVQDISSFPDSDDVSGFAVEGLGWCVSQGIISGDRSTNPPSIMPQNSATRAQAAKMLVVFWNCYNAS